MASGRAALARSDWEEARLRFEAAVAEAETPEALEGLSWAVWWLNDAATVFEIRERAYNLYRTAGDRLGAARMACWIGTDYAVVFANRLCGMAGTGHPKRRRKMAKTGEDGTGSDERRLPCSRRGGWKHDTGG